jgi:oxygen-independent coproporphyrinogen-3 oxidase
MRRYVELVEAEAALWGQRLKRPRVETLHLGGGTPSLLPPALLERLVRALRANFAFAPGLEFGVEANPESVADWTVMETLRRLGVTRLSLGVQSFDDNDLTRLGRPHTAEQAEAAVRLAQGVGFPVVSLDLMWSLPGQRLHHWLANLKKAARLGPQHISCYGLTLEPGTPLERQANETDLGLPDEGEQQRMYLQGGEFLESEGYLQYEISNFARMGFACRHNLGYWQGRDYLGLGPSAVSTLGARAGRTPRTWTPTPRPCRPPPWAPMPKPWTNSPACAKWSCCACAPRAGWTSRPTARPPGATSPPKTRPCCAPCVSAT